MGADAPGKGKLDASQEFCGGLVDAGRKKCVRIVVLDVSPCLP